MANFIVAGITQMETIIKVDSFPIKYVPFTEAHDTIYMAAGGDAFNVSLALKSLGNEIKFMTVVGKDQNMNAFNPPDRRITLPTEHVLPVLKETPAEIFFYDNKRKQQVFEDLKDIRNAEYDMSLVEPVVKDVDMIVLSNANFCRPFIEVAEKHKKKLAVKIHQFNKEKEIYNQDFLSNANILYFSDNTIEEDPQEFAKSIAEKYNTDIIIVGLDEGGLVLYDREKKLNVKYNPVKTKDVVNGAGAGNAAFACFLHYYLKVKDSSQAIRMALLFSAHKIGYMGTSYGFMSEEQMQQWESLIFDRRGV